eukprot:1183377-Prorocentrum_minimum.AAC.2
MVNLKAAKMEQARARVGKDQARKNAAAIHAALLRNGQGRRVDAKGRRVDAKGRRVDAKGRRVDAKGRRVDAKGRRVVSVDARGAGR